MSPNVQFTKSKFRSAGQCALPLAGQHVPWSLRTDKSAGERIHTHNPIDDPIHFDQVIDRQENDGYENQPHDSQADGDSSSQRVPGRQNPEEFGDSRLHENTSQEQHANVLARIFSRIPVLRKKEIVSSLGLLAASSALPARATNERISLYTSGSRGKPCP